MDPIIHVEAGRWRYRSRRFGSAGASSHGVLRMVMLKQATSSYRGHSEARTSQAGVWAEVERKMTVLGSRSDTSALHDVFSDQSAKLERYLEGMTAPSESNGMVVVIDGRIAGAELFDKPATLTKLWVKLLKSYALDALEAASKGGKRVKSEVASEWLRKASSAQTESYDSPGLGPDIRIEGNQVHGATLVVEGRPLHLELFSEPAE